jgi:RNA polymerase sigma factor (sigma-70 family)
LGAHGPHAVTLPAVRQPPQDELLAAVSSAPHAAALGGRTPLLLRVHRLAGQATTHHQLSQAIGASDRTIRRHLLDLAGYGAILLRGQRGRHGGCAAVVRPLDEWTTAGQLVMEMQPIVLRIARQQARRLPRWVPIEEHIQNGQVGLLQAAERYNPFSWVPFSAYAARRIQGAIIDAYRRRNYDYELHGEIADDYDQADPIEPAAEHMADERRRLLESVIGELPPELADAARTYLDEERLLDYGQRSGLSKTAACLRRQEAVEAMREIIAARGIADALR